MGFRVWGLGFRVWGLGFRVGFELKSVDVECLESGEFGRSRPRRLQRQKGEQHNLDVTHGLRHSSLWLSALGYIPLGNHFLFLFI